MNNKLINESSPYLLQHAHNPVNWFPWGKEAFEKAMQEDKPMIISIGYSACHWCHVMERESFENKEIAEIMNTNFISVKVDREEHPEVDHSYITAVQRMNGSAGWPLNCFTLPSGKAFFGGTYFNPEDWKHILLEIAERYQYDKKSFEDVGENLFKTLIKNESFLTSNISKIDNFYFEDLVNAISRFFDLSYGGFSITPKFPMPPFWRFIMDYSCYTGIKNYRDQLELTLDNIRNGGIYDQLGGGFARYSTDRFWKVPHFEKMLYDNALLLSLYADAFQFTGKPIYLNTINLTIQFIINEMKSPEGAFYSSFDADSDGVEGKFYLWTKNEIDSVLNNDSQLFCELFGITENGNYENNQNIFIRNEAIASKLTCSEIEKIELQRKKLLNERNKRSKPALDDKILTAWNALMISGLSDAYRVTKDKDYLSIAEKAAGFILEKMTDDEFLLKRSYKNEQAKIQGVLEDYAFTIEAFIKLFIHTGKLLYIQSAKRWIDIVNELFIDHDSAFYNFTSIREELVLIRHKEMIDSVMPSANSVMASNLRIAGYILSNTEYLKHSEKMLITYSNNIKNSLEFSGNWATLLLKHKYPFYQVIICGKDAYSMLSTISEQYRPNTLIMAANESSDLPIFKDRFRKDQTLIYICKNNVCYAPVNNPEDAISMINGLHPADSV